MGLLHSGSIVTNGLVLCLDAGNARSYPGTGTIWNDLTVINSSCELINSPVYSSTNPGFFQFNTNTVARIPNNTLLDTQTPTVEVWIKTNALNQNGFWFEKGTVNTQYSLFQEGSQIQWRQRFTNGTLTTLSLSSSSINTTKWFQVVGTFVSGNRKLYVNGSLLTSDTATGIIDTNNGGMSIGAYGGYSGGRSYYYNGSLSICRVYNKVLTQDEILQNFNATRGRFGL